jgi:hypothetical protein
MPYQMQYAAIVEGLKKGNRPLVELSGEQINALKNDWEKIDFLRAGELEKLRPILCILDNTQTLSKDWAPQIYQTFDHCPDPDLLVFTLGVAQKHLIQVHHREGRRLPMAFLSRLEKLLQHSNTEVVEWTLRTISNLEHQSIYFRPVVEKLTFSRWKFFDSHSKNARQLVEFLLHSWSLKKI